MKTILMILLAAVFSGGGQIKQWCEEGQKCIENGDGIGAARYYSMCCKSIGVGRSVIPLSSSLYNIAKMYEEAGNYEEAEKYILRSIELGIILERTGSLALRYNVASRIFLATGRYGEALEYAGKGLEFAYESNNENTIGQILLQTGDCYAAMGQYEKCDSLYNEAVGWLYNRGQGKLFVPEAYLKLGDNALQSGDNDKARFYYEAMLNKTKHGYDQLQMYKACDRLAELLSASDPVADAGYRTMADSLDFAPMVNELGVNLALCNIEFTRVEKDAQLNSQRQRARLLLIIAILCVVTAVLLCTNLVALKRRLRSEEKKNADIIKVSLQKDALLSLAASVVKEQDVLKSISEDEIPMPQVKLTQRELQVARLAAQGKLNKEIADELGISIGTVAVHKNKIFRKLGVGNSVELMRYLQKVGL